jgi:hypothetical protein
MCREVGGRKTDEDGQFSSVLIGSEDCRASCCVSSLYSHSTLHFCRPCLGPGMATQTVPTILHVSAVCSLPTSIYTLFIGSTRPRASSCSFATTNSGIAVAKSSRGPVVQQTLLTTLALKIEHPLAPADEAESQELKRARVLVAFGYVREGVVELRRTFEVFSMVGRIESE